MKKFCCFLWVTALTALWLSAARAQTLGQVLRAVQNRRQLEVDANAASTGLGGDGSFYEDEGEPVKLIQWNVALSGSPSDPEVDALSISDQIRVLKQAWQEGYYDQGIDEVGGRITVENFPRAVVLLAGILQRDTTRGWPILSASREWGAEQDHLISEPDLPLSLWSGDFDQYSSTKQGNGPFEPYYTVGSIGGVGFSVYLSYNEDVDTESAELYSCHNYISSSADVQSIGSPSFGGDIQIYASPEYGATGVKGLTLPAGGVSDGSNTPLAHPGRYLWQHLTTSAGDTSEQSLGDLGKSLHGATFDGTWLIHRDPDYGEDLIKRYAISGGFPDQPLYPFSVANQSEINGNTYYGALSFDVVFKPNYGTEFTPPAVPVPEVSPALQIVPDLARGHIKVRLANDPANDCELRWDLDNIILSPDAPVYGSPPEEPFSGRSELHVHGSGNWDAVYSGVATDREPEITWTGTLHTPQSYWQDFEDYIRDWWNPVLTQVVTATYAVDINQQSGGGYTLAFYRRDQVVAKQPGALKYTFTGSPIETWAVPVPAGAHPSNTQLQITTPKAVYNATATANYNATWGAGNVAWTLSARDSTNNAEFLNQQLAITTGSDQQTGYGLEYTQVVDTTKLDGQSLPTVTTKYYRLSDPVIVDQVVETGTEGTRTTAYSYNNGLDHLSGITQTGGPNPYTATYDDNELLTDYTSGSAEIQLAYSGRTVTRAEKFGGQTVRVLTTAYGADGLATATTTVSGVGDAVAATNQLYPGDDPVYPWGPKLIRGFDGTLTTFSYAASGGNFVVTETTGREANSGSGTVAAGTKTTTQINAAGKVVAVETNDIESGLKLTAASATAYQNGTPLPSTFTYTAPLLGPNGTGTTEGISYDGQGRVTSQTDQLGITTTYAWDALGRTTKVVRNGLTWDVSYNPGSLGRFVTLSATGQNNRTWSETTTPFGGTQTLTISGPENLTVTRTETAGTGATLTTTTQNATTQQNRAEVVAKDTLATAITGNATEPWDIAYTVGSGGGWQVTTTHHADGALTGTTVYDPLGRPVAEQSPDPSGSPTPVTTRYGYVGGRLDTVTDPTGSTAYSYQPDGSPGGMSRAGRTLTIGRAAAGGSSLGWVWKDAGGTETLWQRFYDPSTGITRDLPWGEAAQAVTSTPSLTGGVLTLAATGPMNLSATTNWTDGVPTAGSLTQGAQTATWTGQGNPFGELTTRTLKPGNVNGNAQTTTFDALGLPSADSGLVNAAYTNTFGASNGWIRTVTRNGNHALSTGLSPKGDDWGSWGYGVPDGQVSLPNFGASVTRTLSTGAGDETFTFNLAGTLHQRTFLDGRSESFDYDGSGALQARHTPRDTFNFAPNAFGQPTTLGGYGTIGYDASGRVNALTSPADTSTQNYKEGQPYQQAHTAGVLAGQTFVRDYDSLGRLTSMGLAGGVGVTYTYDPATGALAGVTTASGLRGTWSGFDPATGRARQFSLGPLTTSSAWDALGRSTSQVSASGSTAWSYTHHFDADGHCDGGTSPEGTWTYGFDANGYLHTAAVGDAPARTYAFDEAGRESAGQPVDFRPTVRLNSTVVSLFGTVAPAATVKVFGPTLPAAGADLAVDGKTGQFGLTLGGVPAGWQSFLTRGTLAKAGTGGTDAVADAVSAVYVPPASEGLGYDLDGNRASDARWSYRWNTLGQLAGATETQPPGGVAPLQLDFLYDLAGRRVQRTVSGGGQPVRRTTTLWDGWEPFLEVDHDANGVETGRRVYTWGADVSGTVGGAAGVGGLLEIWETRAGGASTTSLPVYDGLGNVVGLVDGTSGARVASFRYGPFGEGLGEQGPRAAGCPVGFQTRLYDAETRLSYFGGRFYDPTTKAFLSRDPLREGGGLNLYAYCQDDPVGNCDPIGLETFSQVYQRALQDSIHAADYGTVDEQATAARALTILPGDARLAPASGVQQATTALLGALAPGPSARDLAESPAQPTGGGFGHQAQLHGLSLLSGTAGLVSLGNDPVRLFGAEPSLSARGFDQAYRARFTYAERSAADFHLLAGSFLVPEAAGKLVDLGAGAFEALGTLRLGGETLAGGSFRLNRFAGEAGSVINPFEELFGDPQKGITVGQSGHHVPGVRKTVGRLFEVGRGDKTRPTIFSRGINPANDHWRLHNAERPFIGPRQGAFPGTDDELFEAYRNAYQGLNDIRVDVRSPNGTHVLGVDVTPLQAVDLIEIWLKEQGLR